jgi:hypothetical protein
MPQKRPVIGGVYRHYKSTGGLDHVYKVTGFAKHSETEEILVVYESLYHNSWLTSDQIQFTVRPLNMFMEKVTIDGITKPRFELISDPNSLEILTGV